MLPPFAFGKAASLQPAAGPFALEGKINDEVTDMTKLKIKEEWLHEAIHVCASEMAKVHEAGLETGSVSHQELFLLWFAAEKYWQILRGNRSPIDGHRCPNSQVCIGGDSR